MKTPSAAQKTAATFASYDGAWGTEDEVIQDTIVVSFRTDFLEGLGDGEEGNTDPEHRDRDRGRAHESSNSNSSAVGGGSRGRQCNVL
ncbi:hypothetical protein PG989_007756 [Apiospora arundinis]